MKSFTQFVTEDLADGDVDEVDSNYTIHHVYSPAQFDHMKRVLTSRGLKPQKSWGIRSMKASEKMKGARAEAHFSADDDHTHSIRLGGLHEDGEAPTNVSGGIAGTTGSPPVSRRRQQEYVASKGSAMVRRIRQ